MQSVPQSLLILKVSHKSSSWIQGASQLQDVFSLLLGAQKKTPKAPFLAAKSSSVMVVCPGTKSVGIHHNVEE